MSTYRRKNCVLKSEFCKKNGISVSVFNKTLIEKGYLENRVITRWSDGRVKTAISINDNANRNILPLHGSNQQGTFQYKESFLNEIFNIETKPKKPKKPFKPNEYKINFGGYKGRLISSMVTKSEIGYCHWVMDNHFNDLSEQEKSTNEKYLAFKWFFEKDLLDNK
jgi:hypothetical protein